MNDYLESIKKRDPAAKSILSIILTYPGVKAVLFHQISNFFYKAGFDLIARIISNACLDGASRASGLGSKKDGPVILRKSELEEENPSVKEEEITSENTEEALESKETSDPSNSEVVPEEK